MEKDRPNNASSTRYECQFCKKVYLNEAFLNEHIKNHKFKEVWKDVIKHSEHYRRRAFAHQCEMCRLKFRVKTDLMAHQKKVHNFQFVCSICERIYMTKLQLQKHGRTHKGRTHHCGICKEVFGTKNKFRNHLQVHKTDASEASKSNKATRTLQPVEEISLVSSDEENNGISTNAAKKSNSSYQFIITPVDESQTASEDSKQEEFEISLIDNESMMDETQLPTAEVVDCFTCDMCTASFTNERSLKSHRNSHFRRAKTFKCNECGKSFTKVRLKYHLLLGTCDGNGEIIEAKEKHETQIESDQMIQCANCNLILKKEFVQEHSSTCGKIIVETTETETNDTDPDLIKNEIEFENYTVVETVQL